MSEQTSSEEPVHSQSWKDSNWYAIANLLLVPLLLLILTALYGLYEANQELIAEENKTQEAYLQNYFDYIETAEDEGDFLNISASCAEPNGDFDDQLNIVRTNTRNLLRKIDKIRLPSLLQFLADGKYFFITLGCDLDDEIKLPLKQVLISIDFSDVSLRNADFSTASLVGADFRTATLIDANFQCADLWQADFRNDAILMGADFTNANLQNARFDTLTVSNFVDVTLPDGSNTGDGIDLEELERFTNIEHESFEQYSCEG